MNIVSLHNLYADSTSELYARIHQSQHNFIIPTKPILSFLWSSWPPVPYGPWSSHGLGPAPTCRENIPAPPQWYGLLCSNEMKSLK